MRALKFLILPLLVLACSMPVESGATAEDGKLEKIVVLSRHGVRSPTQDAALLELWSKKTWPVWPVAKGELTPRGARLVEAMWADLREKLVEYGLLPAYGCPSAGSIYVRADVEERTRATARAILDGLGPDCSLGFAVSRDKIDPLFHPVRAGLYHFNPVSAATSVLDMTDGGMEKLQENLSGSLSLISKINGAPSARLCERYMLTPNCTLNDIPNAVSISSDGNGIRLLGGLSIASSLAEIFLLEYGNWPTAKAGWGMVNATVLGQILPLHSRVFDLVNRAPIVAWARGSSLLTEMTAALFGTHTDQRCNEAKLVVFVGHDTNIANIGSLLNITWQARGYPYNGIPPAGALFLELWNNNGSKSVRARFYAQPPQALHAPFEDEAKAAGLEGSQSHAPVAASINAPPVVGQARFGTEEFARIVANATEGAPLAPQQNPPLEFGSVSSRK